ncbi:ABC transporter permease subunit [Nesterenkonia ebinurensis]|uniref:ABC transporter permease subunit n=1 Tax=Nesterenkonia ebinurensis TaxID=2608252 RepID=UPI00123E3183|nr:ABC transporter permease subunit [Nesterenkonia ebinurensis]
MTPNLNTATATPPKTFQVDPTLPGVSFLGTFRSEFAKLKALRTSWWLSILTIGLSAFIAGSVAISYQRFSDEFPSSALDVAVQGQTGSYFAMILLGALGVIAITTEFTTGAIRSSLTAVPRRTTLLGAKALALVAWTGLTTAIMMLLSHVLAAVITDPLGLGDIVTDGEIALMYAKTWLVVVLTALLGFGLGALLRSSAGGIVVLASILFVVQIVLSILYGVTNEAAWVETLIKLEYMNLVDGFINEPSQYSFFPALETGPALLGLLGWTAVPVALGWLSFTRRDS